MAAKLGQPAQRGIGVGIISFVLYTMIIVFTTPSLKPLDAISVSVRLNWWVMGGISLGTGAQAYLLAYAKRAGCPIKHGKSAAGASGLLSGLSSFVSFLALIPVGCCGTWIYIISFLPGLVGAGASGFLIDDGFQIEIAGLVLMALSVAYTYYSVRKRLNQVRPKAFIPGGSPSRARYIDIFVLLVIFALVFALLVSVLESNSAPTLFKGAYASYVGTTMLIGLSHVNTTRSYEVLDFNATSVEVSIRSSLGEVGFSSTSWTPYSAHHRLHLSGEVFVREYYVVQFLAGKGYRNLIAEEYVQGNTTTNYYYVSNDAPFPIEIITSGSLTMELTLVQTNTKGSA